MAPGESAAVALPAPALTAALARMGLVALLADPPTLEGSRVRLEPLSSSHAADLAVAAEEDRAAYGFTEVPRGVEVGAFLDTHFGRVADGGFAPFAQVRRADGRAVGCTAYLNPRFWPGRPELCAVEVGWTWLGASALGTGINAEAKLLLLAYAFDTLGVARVDFKTDARNERCRAALAGIGASFEGVLRSWSSSHAPGEAGRLRDSAMFSVVEPEWPGVRAALERRLAG